MKPGDLDELFAAIPDPVQDGGARPAPAAPALLEASPTREQGARRRWIAVIVSAVWLVAFSVATGLRGDIGEPGVAVQVAAWTLALPVGLMVVQRPRGDGWPLGPPAQQAALVALAALFIGLALWPLDGMQAPLSFATVTGCMSFAVLCGLPPLTAAVLVLRRSFLNAPALRGAIIGALCGLAGTVGIHTHCPVVTASHVLLAHGLPILLFGGLGAALGAWRGRA